MPISAVSVGTDKKQKTFSGGGGGGLPPGSPPDIMDLIAPQGGEQNSVIHQGKFDQFYSKSSLQIVITSSIVAAKVCNLISFCKCTNA